jgi:hypothetical protein
MPRLAKHINCYCTALLYTEHKKGEKTTTTKKPTTTPSDYFFLLKKHYKMHAVQNDVLKDRVHIRLQDLT